MSIRVVSHRLGEKLYQHDNGHYIGEYEPCEQEEIEEKVVEVVCAAPILREVYAAHGKFLVRWDGKNQVKSVRRADGTEVAKIPAHCWRKPSWELK
jgi:hypothetical protein